MKPLQMAATLNTKPEEKELTEAELADAAAKQAYMEDSNTDDEDAKRAAMFVELGIAEDAGAVVTRDVAPHAVVVGNPARRVAWACRCGEVLPSSGVCARCGDVYELSADACRWVSGRD